MENEIWKPITKIIDAKGQEFSPKGYEVSNMGRVRSYNQRYGKGFGVGYRPLLKTPTIITGRPDPRGYYQVTLTDHTTKNRKNFRIHTLVMQTFIGPAPEGLVICHYNDIKTDNRLENLRYDTPEANSADRERNKSLTTT
jgi:hypothetical protein